MLYSFNSPISTVYSSYSKCTSEVLLILSIRLVIHFEDWLWHSLPDSDECFQWEQEEADWKVSDIWHHLWNQPLEPSVHQRPTVLFARLSEVDSEEENGTAWIQE
jgi:hypothetical protein